MCSICYICAEECVDELKSEGSWGLTNHTDFARVGSLGANMAGNLFTDYFLTDGIESTSEWRTSEASEQFDTFMSGVRHYYNALSLFQDPNEAVTEQELIRPVLELLGWAEYLPQQGASRNEDIPDLLLFPDADAKGRAIARPGTEERYQDAVVVEESKRFGLLLDARGPDGRRRATTPHDQIIRYLSTAETESDGRIRWGVLTNGGVWRLYDYRARPRASGYFEADLDAILKSDDTALLRTFYLLFRRVSFEVQEGATVNFLETALAEGRRYEQQVAQDLSAVVFESAFPSLVQALAEHSQQELAELRAPALILLYRLLFVLYAEDRGLLPVNDSRYENYGLRKPVRDDIARRMADGSAFSARATNYYDHLMTLSRLIDQGDVDIGLPPYNGGLFNDEAAPLLVNVRLPDTAIAPIIYDMSHTKTPEGRRFVNYRDMSVQQLGSIYERLLEREPVWNDDGNVVARPNSYARKDSGSFFTPQELVDLIVARTLKPLADERLTAFVEKAAKLTSDPRPKAERYVELLESDPAEAVLDIKVLDPAMGSGHFLVTAVDFLSDYIAEMVEHAPGVPEWLDDEYVSPLVERVAAIRQDISQRAQAADWVMDQAQLTDQAIIRRMVLKRCIYGADKNPLTVELAKVSLWLHSFTVGAPLSFLDHHLRSGDSLIGLRVIEATAELNRLGGLFASSAITGAEASTEGMGLIEAMSDADIAEVRQSATLFQDVEETTADLRSLLDLMAGLRWLTAGMKQRERRAFEAHLVDTLAEQPDEAYNLLARGLFTDGSLPDSAFRDLWNEAKSIAKREKFLHWEAAFPGVWHSWQTEHPQGGFDAIIGNPPWDRIKLQEVEWFATRSPELAHAQTAAARKIGVEQLRATGSPLAFEFDAAKAQSEALSKTVRASGHYPLLGGGDINLYSLFVERAMGLVKPDGIVGLLTPSGIYADKTASKFFRSVSTSGRLGGLFDFENRKIFFKDIHASFKFCALIFGGEERRFNGTRCAFFLHDSQTIEDPERCFTLTPADFARVNPNTGTAPVFRTRRDAEITRRIYERHPVLVDRSGGGERRTWPVRYVRQLDMTNASHLFRTATQLENEGFYRVEGNHWKKGEELYLPLYEGKMVQAFDHRAASVVVNPQNLNRPAQPRETSLDEHANTGWLPEPQFWVGENSVNWPSNLEWGIGFKDVTAPTNVRTMIASVVPRSAVGNTLPLLMPNIEDIVYYKQNLWLLAACLNSFPLDFAARQKVQGQHLNWFIVEQLPVIASADYDRQFGNMSARDLVRAHVLRLTYTSNDMTPFARDLGYDGPPFAWDKEERRHLRARLDALYFHLYGLSRDDADYILSTFPIVQREDMAEFGTYRTRNLTLAYMNALAAGDTTSKVAE